MRGYWWIFFFKMAVGVESRYLFKRVMHASNVVWFQLYVTTEGYYYNIGIYVGLLMLQFLIVNLYALWDVYYQLLQLQFEKQHL